MSPTFFTNRDVALKPALDEYRIYQDYIQRHPSNSL